MLDYMIKIYYIIPGTKMNIINHYRDKIENILLKEFTLEKSDLKNISLEFPKDTSLGDLSTNASMVLSGKLKKPPQEIASKIINLIENNFQIA